MTSREFRYHFKMKIIFSGQAKWVLPLIKNNYKRITRSDRRIERFERWLRNNNIEIEFLGDDKVKFDFYETK